MHPFTIVNGFPIELQSKQVTSGQMQIYSNEEVEFKLQNMI